MAHRMDRRVEAVWDAGESLSPRSKKWGVGLGIALLLIGYGVYCVATRTAHIPARTGEGMTVGSALATAMGIGYLGLGAFLHFRFFWDAHPKLWRFSGPGKLAGILAFLSGLGYVLFQIFGKP